MTKLGSVVCVGAISLDVVFSSYPYYAGVDNAQRALDFLCWCRLGYSALDWLACVWSLPPPMPPPSPPLDHYHHTMRLTASLKNAAMLLSVQIAHFIPALPPPSLPFSLSKCLKTPIWLLKASGGATHTEHADKPS